MIAKLALMLVISGGVLAQAPPPSPQLSTADKVAIQTFEKAKQDAQKQFNEAQQGETTVIREWEVAHPGFTINPTTFVVEAAKSTKPNPPLKK